MSDESHFDIYNIQKILRRWDMPKISMDFYLEGNAFLLFFFKLSNLATNNVKSRRWSYFCYSDLFSYGDLNRVIR